MLRDTAKGDDMRITDPRRLLPATAGRNGSGGFSPGFVEALFVIGGDEIQVSYHGCGRWSTKYFDPITRELIADINGKPDRANS